MVWPNLEIGQGVWSKNYNLKGVFMRRLKNDIPDVFSNPTASPSLTQEKKILQDANKSWWEKSPMRYDWNSEISHESFTKPFYEEIDRRFFMNASRYMQGKRFLLMRS